MILLQQTFFISFPCDSPHKNYFWKFKIWKKRLIFFTNGTLENWKGNFGVWGISRTWGTFDLIVYKIIQCTFLKLCIKYHE